jgi:hypothetical protein
MLPSYVDSQRRAFLEPERLKVALAWHATHKLELGVRAAERRADPVAMLGRDR